MSKTRKLLVVGGAVLIAGAIAGLGGYLFYASQKKKKETCTTGHHYDAILKRCVVDSVTDCSKVPCPSGYECSGGECVKSANDDCPSACESGTECVQGKCHCTSTSCPGPNYTCVADKCVKVDVCGDIICPAGLGCSAGKCVCSATTCPYPKQCSSDRSSCDDVSCVTSQTCGSDCVCHQGVCTLKPSCGSGEVYVEKENDCQIPMECPEGYTRDVFSNTCVWSGIDGVVGMGFIPTITSGAVVPSGYSPLLPLNWRDGYPSDANPDLNRGGGAGYMYGLKQKATKTSKGIVDIRFAQFDKAQTSPCPAGWVAAINPNSGKIQDLNKGAGGKFLYMCTLTGDSSSPNFIRDIAAANYTRGETCPGLGGGWTAYDFDKGPTEGGDSIYFCLKR